MLLDLQHFVCIICEDDDKEDNHEGYNTCQLYGQPNHNDHKWISLIYFLFHFSWMDFDNYGGLIQSFD